MAQELICTRRLRFEYQRKQRDPVVALNGIDLTVHAGEFLVIIGPNGSGKSTLLKHFNALLVPTSGDILVDRLSTAEERNHWYIRQRCGMVFENPDNQIVASTVEEDVAFGLENLGIPAVEIRRRVKEALAMVGMEKFSQHAPHLLSGGQKQCVAIAGILAMRPVCLLLDEPTAMLDPCGKKEVSRIVKKINREEKITVIWATHFMEEAVTADRVVVLSEGRIAMEGSPQEIFANPEELHALKLEGPPIAELVWQLRTEGMALPPGILTVDELVSVLC
ncbi:MAG: energy-coupling factor transporter ATPase [Dehalococcoidia bacterium]